MEQNPIVTIEALEYNLQIEMSVKRVYLLTESEYTPFFPATSHKWNMVLDRILTGDEKWFMYEKFLH